MDRSDRELANRRIAWDHLSTLFLDTDLSDEQIEQLARSLRFSGFSVAELETILEVELAPLLYANRCSPAGEWSGFDTEWIESAIRNGAHREIHKWYRLIDRFRCRRVLQSVKDEYWDRLASSLSRLRDQQQST